MKALYDGDLIAALPMYDWPERRAEVDAEWATVRDGLRAAGIAAPQQLVRRNGDMPPVPDGIRNAAGHVVAPDPASLPPDELDLHVLWRHPQLVFAQTCWGPMETTGLAAHVTVVGQPDYSDVEGGAGRFYSSALVMRRGAGAQAAAPHDGTALLPLDLLRGARLAFNEMHSRSGRLALEADLADVADGLGLFGETVETGGHRVSIRAVADGRADVAAIDCRSWAMAQRLEPAAARLHAVGWTARRLGLPFIAARELPDEVLRAVRTACESADGELTPIKA